jgi:hypothetical protein
MGCETDYGAILGLVGTVSGLGALVVSLLTYRRERESDRSEKAYQAWLTKTTTGLLGDYRKDPFQPGAGLEVEALDQDASHIARALGAGNIGLRRRDGRVWIQLAPK